MVSDVLLVSMVLPIVAWRILAMLLSGNSEVIPTCPPTPGRQHQWELTYDSS